MATFKSLFEALRASRASPLENPISISRATWKRKNITPLQSQSFIHTVCVLVMLTASEITFPLIRLFKSLPFQGVSKHGYALPRRHIWDSMLENTATEMPTLLSDTLFQTSRLLSMPHLYFPSWSRFERRVKQKVWHCT